MARKRRPGIPTDAELEILNVLWDQGPSTVKSIQEALDHEETPGYTTVLKFLQIMLEKGLVTRVETERAHVYSAVRSRAESQSCVLADMIDRVFGGSAKALMVHALQSRQATDSEIAEIRAMVDKMAKEG